MQIDRGQSASLFEAVESPYLVPEDGSFRVEATSTLPPEGKADKNKCKKNLKDLIQQLDRHQRVFYADDRFSLLLIFQAMDAAGKDGTIRAVMKGINPAGCQVFSFKQPSAEELDHDFLWRTTLCLPERGRIGIFNRSYYEEVLVVRVHPDFLKSQKLPYTIGHDQLWRLRYQSIVDHERHLALNGTVILKFWLNVSRDEQRRRFIARIDDPDKNWKFSEGDVRERSHWDDYMIAYEDALNATSKSWAPWYAIPADDKPFMRESVADIVVRTLSSLSLRYPTLAEEEQSQLGSLRTVLEQSDSGFIFYEK
jgi:PPK2 family polyphosphate:nucleotide phosphotransferase